jgi:Flp pilus assembly protein TadB
MDNFMSINEIETKIIRQKRLILEIENLETNRKKLVGKDEDNMLNSQIVLLRRNLRQISLEIKKDLETLRIENKPKSLPKFNFPTKVVESEPVKKTYFRNDFTLGDLEKTTLKRLRNKETKKEVHKRSKPSSYINISNKLFSKFSEDLIDLGYFRNLKRDLSGANIHIFPKSYISLILLTTFLSGLFSIALVFLLLFFNIGLSYPFISSVSESIFSRLLKVIWIIIIIPGLSFFVSSVYPSLERKSVESKIDSELPFATIHMAAIAGAMIEPSKIFSILVSTKEYPNLEREMIKLTNEVNIFGHDLVSALRNVASMSASKKLTELFNGLATTITSGGDLAEFFDERSQTLLFDYRLEREKETKSAETFMDIYISVVIAAPMILMLLLMMMKVSGLGISLSTTMITVIMSLAVSLVNIVFLIFLNLKQHKS